jgi:lipid-A-disaccharide synthase-like uncharacterized protein
MRILASPGVFTEKDVEMIKTFCRNNKFALAWYPGFAEGSGEENRGDTLARQILQGRGKAFADTKMNIAPATWDRPFFYGIIPLTALPQFLGKLDALPFAEREPVIQIITFAIILVFSGVVLFLFLKKDKTDAEIPVLSVFPYFAVLGMSFALIAAVLSQRCAFFLGNSQDALTTTLLGMFIFTGIGAYRATRFDPLNDQGIKWSVLRTVICLVAYMFILIPVLTLLLPMSPIVKKAAFLLVTAPVAYTAGVSLGLGMEVVMSLRKDHHRIFPAIMGIYVLAGIFIMLGASILALIWGIPLFFFLAVLFSFMAFWFYPRYKRD